MIPRSLDQANPSIDLASKRPAQSTALRVYSWRWYQALFDATLSRSNLRGLTPMSRWYVAQTQPRKELLAAHHLQAQGFTTFCPLRSRPPARHGRQARANEPLFPCYLFVSLDLQSSQWRCVNGTIGVVRIVALGTGRVAMPTPVPEGMVELFQARSNEAGEFQFNEDLKAGDHVRIMGGPFDNLCGTLQGASSAERAIIMLDFMAKQTRVAVLSSQLIAVMRTEKVTP